MAFSKTCGRVLCGLAVGTALGGCLSWHHHGSSPVRSLNPVENPLRVEISQLADRDPQFVWRQVVDAIDDHFTVLREDQPRIEGDAVTPGRLVTQPRPAQTLLEPWRFDSASFEQRLLATTQSIRRRAEVTVTPVPGAYLIEVQIPAELENLPQPENATVSQRTVRYDQSIDARQDGPRIQDRSGLEPWLPIGRDEILEKQLLLDLKNRLLAR